MNDPDAELSGRQILVIVVLVVIVVIVTVLAQPQASVILNTHSQTV